SGFTEISTASSPVVTAPEVNSEITQPTLEKNEVNPSISGSSLNTAPAAVTQTSPLSSSDNSALKQTSLSENNLSSDLADQISNLSVSDISSEVVQQLQQIPLDGFEEFNSPAESSQQSEATEDIEAGDLEREELIKSIADVNSSNIPSVQGLSDILSGMEEYHSKSADEVASASQMSGADPQNEITSSPGDKAEKKLFKGATTITPRSGPQTQ
ncbi:MAG: hypothetical protein KC649_07380, partial [Candidatus Omnitrophica bacterium]|nr:hypothetical protein [Candidatus Omnitrophota bacterium]